MSGQAGCQNAPDVRLGKSLYLTTAMAMGVYNKTRLMGTQYTAHRRQCTVHHRQCTVRRNNYLLRGMTRNAARLMRGYTQQLAVRKTGAGACERVSVCTVTSMVGRCDPGVIVANSIISRLQAENIRNIYFYCRSRVNET